MIARDVSGRVPRDRTAGCVMRGRSEPEPSVEAFSHWLRAALACRWADAWQQACGAAISPRGAGSGPAVESCSHYPGDPLNLWARRRIGGQGSSFAFETRGGHPSRGYSGAIKLDCATQTLQPRLRNLTPRARAPRAGAPSRRQRACGRPWLAGTHRVLNDAAGSVGRARVQGLERIVR